MAPVPAFIAAAQSGFGFVTLHRPSNVDDPATLSGLLKALADVSCDLPLIFAMHPRTKAIVAVNGLQAIFDGAQILLTLPLSYLQLARPYARKRSSPSPTAAACRRRRPRSAFRA